MTSCEKVRCLYSLHLEGETSPVEGTLFEQHLAECPACREDYAVFLATTGAVRDLPPPVVSPGFEDRVLARIRAASVPEPDAAGEPIEVSLEPRGWARWFPRLAPGGAVADVWLPRLVLAGVTAALAVLVTLAITTHRTAAPGGSAPTLAATQPAAATPTPPAEGITDLRQLFPDLPPELTASTQSLGGENYVMDRMVIRPGSSAGDVQVVAPVATETRGPVYVTF
jgi:anti-sigma factor RsiW